MHIDNGLAALKLLEERFQRSLAETYAVGVREEHNAIEPEDVLCVRQLFQRGIDIG
jgi:hypothetical protein